MVPEMRTVSYAHIGIYLLILLRPPDRIVIRAIRRVPSFKLLSPIVLISHSIICLPSVCEHAGASGDMRDGCWACHEHPGRQARDSRVARRRTHPAQAGRYTVTPSTMHRTHSRPPARLPCAASCAPAPALVIWRKAPHGHAAGNSKHNADTDEHGAATRRQADDLASPCTLRLCIPALGLESRQSLLAHANPADSILGFQRLHNAPVARMVPPCTA